MTLSNLGKAGSNWQSGQFCKQSSGGSLPLPAYSATSAGGGWLRSIRRQQMGTLDKQGVVTMQELLVSSLAKEEAKI